MSARERSGTTKHEELTQTLRELVGTLKPGDRLPSQAELMRAYRVSDRTVLRSLDDLRRAGWIIRRHGSGTFVADPTVHRRELPQPPAWENKTVGALALTQPPSPFYQRCLDVLAGLTQEAGWSLVCHHAPKQQSYRDALPLEALGPRGFVVFNYELCHIAQHLIERGHRAVVVGPPPADSYPTVPCVCGDHDQGGYLATKHLLDLGHRRLAYVRKELQHSLTRSYRWKGHERALREAAGAGQRADCDLVSERTFAAWCADPTLAGDYFRAPHAPTGVLVWNDSEAALLLRILQTAGIRVPEDVSVVGYDALPEGEQSFPPLTTIDQHIPAQLRAVIDTLSRPEPPPNTHMVVVVPTLVCRTSTAPPRPQEGTHS